MDETMGIDTNPNKDEHVSGKNYLHQARYQTSNEVFTKDHWCTIILIVAVNG